MQLFLDQIELLKNYYLEALILKIIMEKNVLMLLLKKINYKKENNKSSKRRKWLINEDNSLIKTGKYSSDEENDKKNTL